MDPGRKKKPEQDMLSDLIVLGLPYSSTEEDVKTYFEKYGELAHCEVCNLFVMIFCFVFKYLSREYCFLS